MAKVDIPLNTAVTATVDAEFVEHDGFEPTNVIHKDDPADVRATIELSGLFFDTASLVWDMTLRIEGNPYTPGVEAPDYILTAQHAHNGQPNGSTYTYVVDIPIPEGTLAVPNGKSQSYELTLELVALDDNTGAPHGMAGFVDLGEILVFDGPDFD